MVEVLRPPDPLDPREIFGDAHSAHIEDSLDAGRRPLSILEYLDLAAAVCRRGQQSAPAQGAILCGLQSYQHTQPQTLNTREIRHG